jgi:dolichol-phosphate mannosyltransferase
MPPSYREPKTFLVMIPCYNEESAIEKLSQELTLLRDKLIHSGIDLSVIWINDASRDRTGFCIDQSVSKNSWQKVIHHKTNLNLVGVMETILSRYSEFIPAEGNFLGVGVLDGDSSHPPSFFSEMISKSDLGYDVVIASRFQVGSVVRGVPAHRHLFSVGMSILFRCFGRIPNVKDYSCGYRIYSADLLKKIGSYRFRCRSFACMVELLVAAHHRGATICETPFILRYDLKESSSKMRVVQTIFETLRVLLRSTKWC